MANLTVSPTDVAVARQQRPVHIGAYTGSGLIGGTAVVFTFPVTDMDPSTQPLKHDDTMAKVAANLPPHAVAACNLSIDLKMLPGGIFFLISATPLYPAKDLQDPNVAAACGLMGPSAPPRYMLIREARVAEPTGKRPAPAEAGPAGDVSETDAMENVD